MKHVLGFFKDTLWGYIKNDWILKLVSILLAIVIWFLICEYVDPDTDIHVNNIRITVEDDGSDPQVNGLGRMTVIDETVSFRVTGSRDMIALMNRDAITAYLDMKNVDSSGEWDLPVVVDLGGQNIKIVEGSQTPMTLPVKFDKVINADVKVNVSVLGKVKDGCILEEPTMVNNYVKVTGPMEIVNSIVSAEVVIDEKIFEKTNTFTCDYKFVDKDGNEVAKTFLTTDIEKVEVKVGVVTKKTVPFAVNIINSSGGNDSTFCTAKIKPSEITIIGTEEALATINSINLGVIDVAEKTEDFELSMPVVLQDGIKNVDNIETVKVSVAFTDVQQQSFAVSKLILENLPDGTDAKIQEKKLVIKVRGLPADIKALNSKDIKAIIDVKNQALKPGTYRLNALIDFPDDLNVGTIGKYQVTLVVT